MLKINAIVSPFGPEYQIGEKIGQYVLFLQHLPSKAYILNLMRRIFDVNHKYSNILVAISVYND